MKQSLPGILIRIFSYGFFKVHASQLLFLFITLISYCFFINTLGTVPLSEMIYAQYLMTITLVKDPFIMGLFFIVCLIYNIKSWQYVALQLSGAEQQFIYYSTTAMSRQKQFRSWFLVQLFINLPSLVYAVFALCIGLIWHYYLLPVLIFAYLLLLTGLGAWIYLKLVNRIADTPGASPLFRLTRHWKKPLFSLFIYHILDKQKIAFMITKALTAIIIGSGLFKIGGNTPHYEYMAGIVVVMVVLSHSVLIYQEQHFEQYYLSFVRNFPYGWGRIYLTSMLTHILLLLPEYIWFLIAFPLPMGFTMVLLGIGTAQLLRGICYRYASRVQRFLLALFILFLALFWCIMFGFMNWLIPANFLVSFIFLYNNYFRTEYQDGNK